MNCLLVTNILVAVTCSSFEEVTGVYIGGAESTAETMIENSTMIKPTPVHETDDTITNLPVKFPTVELPQQTYWENDVGNARYKVCQLPWMPDNVGFKPSRPPVRSGRETFWPGTWLTFYCKKPYLTLIPAYSGMTCTSDGRWTSNTVPICYQAVDKHRPCEKRTVSNGAWTCASQNCDKIVVGTQFKLMCEEGYQLSGSSLVKCGSDGRWSPDLPRCISHTPSCPVLTVRNGTVICITNDCLNFHVKSMVHISCNQGFGLLGSPTLSCREDGTWSSRLPQCIPLPTRSCGMPYKIQHGQWEVGGYEVNQKYPLFGVGARVLYRCDGGYELVGDRILICKENGQWSNYPPKCNPQILCNDPGTVENGRYACADESQPCGDYSVGIRLVFLCDDGYQRVGDHELTCRETGAWSADKPTCTKVSSADPPMASSSLRNTTTVVIVTACSVLGALMLVMLVVAIQRRRPPRRLEVFPPPYSPTYTPPLPEPEQDRLALIAYDGISLPSYDEVVSQSRPGRATFGSNDTVDGTVASTTESTSVTVDTYDSGASVPSVAQSSRRAMAGSIASTSDVSSLHKEESPLLEQSPDELTSQDAVVEEIKDD